MPLRKTDAPLAKSGWSANQDGSRDLHQYMAEAVQDRGSPDHEHGVADGPAAANDAIRPDLRDLRIAGGKDRDVHVAAQGERNPLLELASG